MQVPNSQHKAQSILFGTLVRRCEDDDIFDEDLPVEPLEASWLHPFTKALFFVIFLGDRRRTTGQMYSRDRCTFSFRKPSL